MNAWTVVTIALWFAVGAFMLCFFGFVCEAKSDELMFRENRMVAGRVFDKIGASLLVCGVACIFVMLGLFIVATVMMS